jgi:hypothetical protein
VPPGADTGTAVAVAGTFVAVGGTRVAVAGTMVAVADGTRVDVGSGVGDAGTVVGTGVLVGAGVALGSGTGELDGCVGAGAMLPTDESAGTLTPVVAAAPPARAWIVWLPLELCGTVSFAENDPFPRALAVPEALSSQYSVTSSPLGKFDPFTYTVSPTRALLGLAEMLGVAAKLGAVTSTASSTASARNASAGSHGAARLRLKDRV